ncbi:hypothetical protein FQN60_009948, partial [Etheostoma spectabile]
MDQCFRIALWMFFLVVYLQAKPTPASFKFNLDDLALDLLEDITCNDNVTFTSPTNVNEKNCYNATLTHFMDQLEQVKKICKDEELRIDDTLTALKNGPQCTTISPCKLETKKSEFKNFLNDIQNF